MAVTKIKAIRGTLSKAIAYILNPEKTDEKLLVSSYGCASETAAREFEWTRKIAEQKGMNPVRIIARHVIQSFEIGEVTPELAHEIGKQFADEILGGKYEYVLTTHIDKDHVHNHLIFNAVDFVGYHAYKSYKRIYYDMREVSDRLCKENGLSVIPPSQNKGMGYKEFHTEAAGTDYDTSLTVDIALKTASFTSATFSVKRNGFEKAYYNFITKADFDRKYGGNADTYVQRELIGKESGYPITLYSDNDINGSRLAYDTQYVLIALPEADNEDRYGVPTVVEFETLGYEATGSATATIAVNSITDNYGVSFYASVTVTPGADCAGYYYAMIEKTAYDAAANLGETICKQNGVKYRAATEDTTFSTDYYFAESYLVLIPVDNNGKMSAPVTSELLTTSAK